MTINGFANYNPVTVNVIVELVNKTVVDITGVTMTGGVYKKSQYAYAGTPVFTPNAGGAAVTVSPFDVLYESTDGGNHSSATAPTDEGDYKLTISVPAANVTYSGSKVYTFTIDKRPITLVAENKSVVLGENLPALTYSVQNLAANESKSDALSAEPALNCLTFDSTAIGSYPITITGGTETANYEITGRTEGSVTVAAQTYAVTVINGTGSGSFAEGVTVNIAANTAPGGQTFDKWTTSSSGVIFTDETSATTSFIMPANSVAVTATYKSTGGNGGGGGSSSGGGGGGGSGRAINICAMVKPDTPQKILMIASKEY